ncbi:T9SS type A sorting domain-containing protein [Flavobacterium microcysteis]|nr:T9SS type A sorting domain-containing protein [Flavobacterium microcysteis]
MIGNRKNLLTLIALGLYSSMFSQSEGIVGSSANYSGYMSFNTGEVFVVFKIQNEDIVSKSIEIIPKEQENLLEDVDDIIVYPNPVSAILNISSISGKPVGEIFIFSSEGKMVLNQEVVNNQIDLSRLAQGTYILKTDISSSKTFKIIKQ